MNAVELLCVLSIHTITVEQSSDYSSYCTLSNDSSVGVEPLLCPFVLNRGSDTDPDPLWQNKGAIFRPPSDWPSFNWMAEWTSLIGRGVQTKPQRSNCSCDVCVCVCYSEFAFLLTDQFDGNSWNCHLRIQLDAKVFTPLVQHDQFSVLGSHTFYYYYY